MKILFCIDRFQPSRGGAESYLADLIAGLHARGHRIFVAARQHAWDGPAQQIRIEAPAFPRWLGEAVFAYRSGRLRKQGDFDRVLAFRHALDADLFQPHEGLFRDSLLGSLRPWSKHPLLRKILLVKKLLSLKNLFFLYADRRLLSHGDGIKIAALSEKSAQAIIQRFPDQAPAVSVIPNGVDGRRFYPRDKARSATQLRKSLGFPEKGHLLLFAGHNFKLKGLKEALDGIATFRAEGGDPYLLVAGRGKKTPYLRQISRLGLSNRIRFLGETEQMAALYTASAVLLHPTYYDPCSLVVLEALGCGTPVITTIFNGAAELMRDRGAGKVLDSPRDRSGMAMALQDILEADHYPAFSANAAALGAAHDFSLHLNRMESWITSE